jgi:hypothetical protein
MQEFLLAVHKCTAKAYVTCMSAAEVVCVSQPHSNIIELGAHVCAHRYNAVLVTHDMFVCRMLRNAHARRRMHSCCDTLATGLCNLQPVLTNALSTANVTACVTQ